MRKIPSMFLGAQLVAELESFPMEVIGNIHDLRDSVKLGREICKAVWDKDEREVLESLLELGTDPLDRFIVNISFFKTSGVKKVVSVVPKL
jgi:hypothetical protein